jgi:hypothetical protein
MARAPLQVLVLPFRRRADDRTAHRWLAHEEAARLLTWDSNKTALWELNERLGRGERAAK